MKRFPHFGGTDGYMQHRGGDRGSWVRGFQRQAALGQTTIPNKNNSVQPIKRTFGSKMKWDNPMPLTRGNGTETIAVAGDKVLVGFSVTHSDRSKE